ncbi:MAG: hypothetical protein ACK56I_03975, partial [bacterium]
SCRTPPLASFSRRPGHSSLSLLSRLRRRGFLLGCVLGGLERLGFSEDTLGPVLPHQLLQCLLPLLLLLTLLV